MATALIRTTILYFLIMIGLRLTGKRQLGELEPGELVLTMMLSDLAAVPMQDQKIEDRGADQCGSQGKSLL